MPFIRQPLELDEIEPLVHFKACILYGSRRLDERQFKSFFGASSRTISVLWCMLCDQQKSPPFKVIHLLWALAWLKQYPTETVLAALFKASAKTIRKRVKMVLEAINSRYFDVVSTIFY